MRYLNMTASLLQFLVADTEATVAARPLLIVAIAGNLRQPCVSREQGISLWSPNISETESAGYSLKRQRIG